MPNDVSENPFQHLLAAVCDGLILSDIATGAIVLANPAAGAMYGCASTAMVGQLLERFLEPAGYTQLLSAVAAASANGTNFAATIAQTDTANQPFTVEIRGTETVFQDRPCLLSVFRDVSARIHSEQQLKQLVASRTREQATLLKISQAVASSLELQPTLILEQLRMIVAYSHAVLFTLTDRELVALAASGSPQLERAMPLRILLQDPAAAAQLRRLQPSRIANVWREEPAALLLRSLLNEHSDAFLAGAKAWLWVPLAVKGQVIGGLGIAHREEDFFTDHLADLALTMANQSAIALVNAQLYEQAQTAASLQERQRLAQHLHDAVNQSLFSAGLIAEVLPRLWEKDHDAGRQSLQDLRRLTRGAQAELRGLLAELRPQVLVDSELPELLRQLGNAFTGRTNVAVTVTSVGQGHLPADVQVTFYRLCQEAFNNIAKHAQANQVTIHLEYDTGKIDLVIRDDGRGFQPERISAGHYGLSMMRERAEAAGILLTITSQPGSGTEIAIRWLVVPEAISL